MRALHFFLLFLYAPSVCSGQQASLSHYDVKNGLVENFVTTIARDDRGFMWFGTTEGLSRFDGTTFKNYLAGRNRNSLFSNDIKQVVALSKGRIAIMTSFRVVILETTLDHFYHPPDFVRRMVRSIQKIDAGHYLVSSDTCFITDENLNIMEALIPSSNYLTELEAYPLERNLVLVANTHLYFIYNRVTKNFTQIPLDMTTPRDGLAFSCYDSARHCLYFNNFFNGLYRYSLAGSLLKRWPVREIEFVKQIDNFTFMVGRKLESNGSLHVLDIRNDSVKTLDIGKKDFDAVDVFVDMAGTQWIATSQGFTRRKPWKLYIKNWTDFADLPAPNRPAGKITKSADGGIYLTFSLEKYLYRHNGARDDWELADKDIGVYAWSMNRLGSKLIVIGRPARYATVAPAAAGSQRFVPLQQYFPSSEIVTMGFRHSNGDDWFSANRGGGLIRIGAKDKVVHHYKSFSGLNGRPFSYFSAYAEDGHGDLWFGVNKRTTLAHWDKKRDAIGEISLDTVSGTKGEPIRGINALAVDAKNKIWLGLDGTGLVQYDPLHNNTIHYTFENGLASAFITSLVFDKKGRLWIGTPKGLSYMNPDNEHIQTFTKADGFCDDRFVDSCIFYDSAENNMWIGSASSVTRFNPDSLVNQKNPPIKLLIDEVLVNGKANHSLILKHELEHDENNLLFRFAAIDFEERDIQYNYRLSSHDADWVDNLGNTSTSYANLEPGHYSFMVRARHKGDKSWTGLQQPFTFVIDTPWFKTWWFRLSVACAFGFGFFFVARLYYLRTIDRQRLILEKQQAVETERTRIATDMHDDFGATLSRIKFISEKMKLRPLGSEDLNHDLSKISAFSDEISEKMNEIVWALNERYDTLEDLISFSRAYAADYSAQHNLELDFVCDNISNMKISAELRRNVFLVLKESLHNVVKHANARKVKICFEQDRQLNITFSDDGKGIDMQKIRPFSNGLRNMKERMTSIQGILEITAGCGTTISMKIPLNNY